MNCKNEPDYGELENITPESSWEELTWVLDEYKIRIDYDYETAKLFIDTSESTLEEIPDNLKQCLKNNLANLKRFILETDKIRFMKGNE